MPYKIREMASSEIDKVLQLIHQCHWPVQPQDRKRFAVKYEWDANLMLVACDPKEEIVGFLTVTYDSFIVIGTCLSIHPDHHNQGVEQLLIDAVKVKLRSRDINHDRFYVLSREGSSEIQTLAAAHQEISSQ